MLCATGSGILEFSKIGPGSLGKFFCQKFGLYGPGGSRSRRLSSEDEPRSGNVLGKVAPDVMSITRLVRVVDYVVNDGNKMPTDFDNKPPPGQLGVIEASPAAANGNVPPAKRCKIGVIEAAFAKCSVHLVIGLLGCDGDGADDAVAHVARPIARIPSAAVVINPTRGYAVLLDIAHRFGRARMLPRSTCVARLTLLPAACPRS